MGFPILAAPDLLPPPPPPINPPSQIIIETRFTLDQVSKALKENSTEDAMGSFNERMRNLRLKSGQDQVVEEPPVADKAASLRARLEALKHSSCEVMVEKS
jgi:hypothetical protein